MGMAPEPGLDCEIRGDNLDNPHGDVGRQAHLEPTAPAEIETLAGRKSQLKTELGR